MSYWFPRPLEKKEWIPGYYRTYEIRHHHGKRIKCYQSCAACRYGGNGAGCDEGDGMTIHTKPTYYQKKYGLEFKRQERPPRKTNE